MDYELKPEQLPGFTKLVTQKRHFLCFKMGLGKTVVTTRALYEVRKDVRTVLIICPKNAIRVWEDHLNEWIAGLDAKFGEDTWYSIFRYKGKHNNAAKRKAVLSKFDPESHLNVYITTYGAFIKDADVIGSRKYDCIIIDEAKRIRNRKSKAYELLKPLAKSCQYFWPLTGTPGKSPGDFFTIFNLMDPKYYSSYWKFVGAFCHAVKNQFGQLEIIAFKNKDEWYRTLNNKCSFLTKSEIGHRETQRQLLSVDLDEDQERIYKELEENDIAIGPDNLIVAQTAMTKVLRFRQAMVCPKILDPNLSIGSAFADYVETIQNDTDPHTVVFTPFTQAIPHFVEYLRANGFNNVETIIGGLDPDELQRRIDRFRATKGIAVVSILCATAFSLEPATECFFVGYEWDPEDNAQAEDRLNRLTTKHQVNAYYYTYNGTYTQQHLQILTSKQRMMQMTLGGPHGITKK